MLTILFWVLAAVAVALTATVAINGAMGVHHVLVVPVVATLALGIVLWYVWSGWWRVVPVVLLVAAIGAMWRLRQADATPA